MTAVSGNTVVPSGTASGFSSSLSNWAWVSVLSFAIAASTSSCLTRGNSSREPPRRRSRVRDPDEVAVVAGRHDADRAGAHVALLAGLVGRDRDLARGAADRDVGRAAGDPGDRQEHLLVDHERDAARACVTIEPDGIR